MAACSSCVPTLIHCQLARHCAKNACTNSMLIHAKRELTHMNINAVPIDMLTSYTITETIESHQGFVTFLQCLLLEKRCYTISVMQLCVCALYDKANFVTEVNAPSCRKSYPHFEKKLPAAFKTLLKRSRHQTGKMYLFIYCMLCCSRSVNYFLFIYLSVYTLLYIIHYLVGFKMNYKVLET